MMKIIIGTSILKVIFKGLLSDMVQTDLASEAGNELIDKFMDYAEKKGIATANSLEWQLKKILQSSEREIPEEHWTCIIQQINDIFTENLIIPTQYYSSSNLTNFADFLIKKYMELPLSDREHEAEVKYVLRLFAPYIIEANSKSNAIFEDIIAELERCRRLGEKNAQDYTALSCEVQELKEIIVMLESRIEKRTAECDAEKIVDSDSPEPVTTFYRYWNKICVPVKDLPEEDLEKAL